jgi:hypothetical protein
MKHKFFSLSVFAIALIVSSCSSDIDEGQTPGVNSGNGQAIKFEAWANKQTKAAPTQADDMTEFAVLATDPTSATPVLIDGAVVGGSNAGGWTYTPVAYWPENASVNSFAFSPTGAAGITNGAAALVGQSDAPASGTPAIEYELPAVLADQEDLLVARHSGTYAQDGRSGVLLNFRHALSRVKFQAKSESGMAFVVLSIKLKNVKSKATLDLNKVPKDATAFAYPTNNATVASPGYQTFWVPDNPTTPAVVDLTAKLTNDTVPGGGAWADIVGNDDALYVIPQINDASAMDSATVVEPGDPDPQGFYIEITYKDIAQIDADAKTYAVPVPAIVGDAYKSSIAFEMERQYTFQFELFGRKPIEYKGVKVSDYKDVTQEEALRLTWAGSNIYWDGTKLTFDDSSDTTNAQYQGVFFKWGSLVGQTPEGIQGTNWGGETYYPTNPGVDDTWKTDATKYGPGNLEYAGIPYAMDPLTAPYNRNYAYLTELTNKPDSVAAYKGDICVYLTNIGAAPKGKRWRMPTSAEFIATSDYTTIGVNANYGNAAGTAIFAGGWQRTDLNQPYFPITGYRTDNGRTYYIGQRGGYWSSSPSSAANGYNMGGMGSGSGVGAGSGAASTNRQVGFPVRCVVH